MHSFAFPTRDELDRRFREHYGNPLAHGWRIRMWHWFGYFTPDATYQAIIDRLVDSNTNWIDVGGGKSIFPNNRKLSCEVAARCSYLVGVDPSDNVEHNDLVDERSKKAIEQYRSARKFDLATLRMVAEHIQQPEEVVQSLAELVKPEGYVVVYTPYRWSISAILSSLIPYRLHTLFARVLSPSRKKEDVFPTCYKMNTRCQIKVLFDKCGFQEVGFAYLDDCILLHRFRATCFMELAIWKLFDFLRWRYPECNLLGIYQKT